MPDEPAVSPPIPQIPLSAIGSAVAPVIYFEGAPNFGFNEGVANITLEALVYTSVNGAIITERQTVAHLRMSAQTGETEKRDSRNRTVGQSSPRGTG
jgi:hypothetical protein